LDGGSLSKSTGRLQLTFRIKPAQRKAKVPASGTHGPKRESSAAGSTPARKDHRDPGKVKTVAADPAVGRNDAYRQTTSHRFRIDCAFIHEVHGPKHQSGTAPQNPTPPPPTRKVSPSFERRSHWTSKRVAKPSTRSGVFAALTVASSGKKVRKLKEKISDMSALHHHPAAEGKKQLQFKFGLRPPGRRDSHTGGIRPITFGVNRKTMHKFRDSSEVAASQRLNASTPPTPTPDRTASDFQIKKPKSAC